MDRAATAVDGLQLEGMSLIRGEAMVVKIPMSGGTGERLRHFNASAFSQHRPKPREVSDGGDVIEDFSPDDNGMVVEDEKTGTCYVVYFKSYPAG
jgi:hypothetical protein